MWRADLPHLRDRANGPGNGLRSRLRLLEDDRRLRFANAHRPAVALLGDGRYQHWEDGLLFSASDSGDPNTNGRTYAWFLDEVEDRLHAGGRTGDAR